VNVIIQQSQTQLSRETDTDLFLTKVAEPGANLDIEDIMSENDSHADIMLEITQKRAQME